MDEMERDMSELSTSGGAGAQDMDVDIDYADLVRGLLDDVQGTAITVLEVRHDGLRVVLRRAPGAVAQSAPGAYGPAAVAAPVRPEHWHPVTAPLTGIFYARPSPDDEPYVTLGAQIESDQVIGLIESMKMFNEVTADVTGTVREIGVVNGDLIETGYAILYVEPGEVETQAPAAGGG